MPQSKNNLSMINFLFFLGISLPLVAAGTNILPEIVPEAPASCEGHRKCYWVKEIWKQMVNDPDLNLNNGCCTIPGVVCNKVGRVIQLDWDKNDFRGKIPSGIGCLTGLLDLMSLFPGKDPLDPLFDPSIQGP